MRTTASTRIRIARSSRARRRRDVDDDVVDDRSHRAHRVWGFHPSPPRSSTTRTRRRERRREETTDERMCPCARRLSSLTLRATSSVDWPRSSPSNCCKANTWCVTRCGGRVGARGVCARARVVCARRMCKRVRVNACRRWRRAGRGGRRARGEGRAWMMRGVGLGMVRALRARESADEREERD